MTRMTSSERLSQGAMIFPVTGSCVETAAIGKTSPAANARAPTPPMPDLVCVAIEPSVGGISMSPATAI